MDNKIKWRHYCNNKRVHKSFPFYSLNKGCNSPSISLITIIIVNTLNINYDYLHMDTLKLNNHSFKSRLLLGTGKFSSAEVMKNSIIASESEIITAAVRRIDLDNPEDSFLTRWRDKNFRKCGHLPLSSGKI